MSQLSEYLAVILLHRASLGANEALGGSVQAISRDLSKELYLTIPQKDIRESLVALQIFAASEEDFSPLTGGYWQVEYDNFRYYFIEGNPDSEDDDLNYREISKRTEEFPILQAYARRGARYAIDVIQHFQESPSSILDELRDASSENSLFVPASNRIVRLDHNQSNDISEKTLEIIQKFSGLNTV